MTKEIREAAYLHFRDLEKNYIAREDLDKGLTATSFLRAKAKKDADALLKRNSELSALDTPVKEKVVEEVKEVKENKSKKGK